MRSYLLVLGALSSVLVAAAPAVAATLTVGPGKTYATPCAAIAAAQPNDEVDVSPGTYTDTCSIAVSGLTLKGVGGQPKIDLTGGSPSGQKGIYVIDAPGVTIENLELTGAVISAANGENGAGIRVEAQNLTVRGCYIHDNQNGILGQPLTAGGTLLIEGNEFSHNALGNGCDDSSLGDSCTHNVYIGANVQTLTFQYNWSHNLATDTPDKGHLLKSRAQQSYVLYNRLTGETDTDSYEIDLPQGGLAVVVGNLVEKPPSSGNGISLAYAEEGLSNADHRIFVAGNTFVNNHGGNGPFLNIANGGVLVAHNNLFIGMGSPSSTGALSADNLVGQTSDLVDAATYDYHLVAGSAPIGKAVAPGSADTFSLVPVSEYVQPLSHVARTADADVGAYEFGTAPGTGGGSATGSGGATASSSSGSTTSTSSTAGAGGASGTGGSAEGTGGSSSSGSPGAKSGCGCVVAGDGATAPVALLGALAFLSVAGRRRRRG